jgi:dihydroxyacetone kinase
LVSRTEVARVLLAIARRISDLRDELNRLDAASGDGDLGVTLTEAAAATEAALGSDAGDVPSMLHACGAEIARRAPSTSGTLIATGFLAAARVEHGATPIESLAQSLEAAEASIKARGKAQYGDRTLLDALGPAVATLRRAADEGMSVEAGLGEAALAARDGAAQTATMEPRAGRARWIPERARGNEDGGAVFVAIALETAWRTVAGDAAGRS